LAKNKCLGIHYDSGKMTAVRVEKHGGKIKNSPAIYIKPEKVESNGGGFSFNDHVEKLLSSQREKGIPVALSLGGDLYHTQPHHSEFTDSRQIDQTLRYDIEDAFAINADSVALCYQKILSDDSGTDLLVHTAEREPLRELFDQFYQIGADALIGQPDIVSWIHYLENSSELPSPKGAVVVGWTGEYLYILIMDSFYQPILERCCRCESAEQVCEIFSGELVRILAVLDKEQQPSYLLYHSQGFDVNCLDASARRFDLKSQSLQEPDITVAFAVGAALSWIDGRVKADFRANGLAPKSEIFQRKKMLYGLSAALTFLFISLIIIIQAQVGSYQGIKEKTRKNIISGWKQVNREQIKARGFKKIPRLIDIELKKLREKYSGQPSRSKPDSASNTLMLVLQALDNLPYDFDLRIKKLDIEAKGVSSFNGTVPDLKTLEDLFKAVEKNGSLKITREDWLKTGGDSKNDPTQRRSFNIPLQVVKVVEDGK